MIEVPLTQGKVALIDDEDADRVLIHKWTLLTITCYALQSINPSR